MSNENHVGNLNGFYYSTMSRAQLRESFDTDPYLDALTRTFAAFHRTLDLCVSAQILADPLQEIAFSDSAFVAFRDVNTATYFAESLMRDLISFGVPARMGIGQGSFQGLRFSTDISDGFRRHSSQFLGTGVIRARQAESCGLKGLRIFIHPDSKIKGDWPGGVCEVGDDERGRMGCPVTHELNYVEHHPDFEPRPGGAQTTDEAYNELIARVTEMMNASPAQVKFQYKQTLAVLARMRDAYEPRD